MKSRISQLAQSGATDGQVITWDNTAGEWVPDTPAAGGSLTVQDENGTVATGVTQIDFQGAGVTAASVSGEVVVTIPGGGGSFTQAYVGRNSVGASYETLVSSRLYMKKITLSAAGLLNSVDVHVKDSGSAQVHSLSAFVMSDSSGTPTSLTAIGSGASLANSLYLSTTARWVALSLGAWLAAGDYWIGVCALDAGSVQIAYDATGTDRYVNSGGAWLTDASNYTVTTSSNDYSLRASVIS